MTSILASCVRRMIAAVALSATLALIASAALAQSPEPRPLNDQDLADIARVETYLNGLTTVQSRFIQSSSQGNIARGEVFISRPGRLRFEYDPPTPVLLVADGLFLIYVDKELEQISQIPIGSTPLGILIDKQIKFGEKAEVVDVTRDPGLLRVTSRMVEEPEAGTVTMVFSESPLALRQWTIVDAQGTSIRVALLDPRRGMPLDKELFVVDQFQFDGDSSNN